ncbi:MetQ/NlpA family ABC transporter substrate-binding protein [Larsenimonas sp. GH3-8]|uniref:Lipoprotein n=2 Tax=Larsenimonas rhizosphaerae TaxID=2944682 RepID=A0AA41ZD78_9GAMM|nr:MetQ/NlpA family ABC transporter substrate-binding protein [Larsenimonas rhizosphaerae]MCX2523149.1 MetQ/NlpA family ABC transporter substrate-binding protein [Larsenimonas rhizosphaerae]
MRFPLRSMALAAVTLGTMTLAGCGGDTASDDNVVKVGTMAGPETSVMEAAKKVAKEKYDLDVQIVEFTDYNSPNAALADGSLDANAYQHKPYLENMVNDRGYDFAIAGNTFVYPIGAYSKKYSDINDIPEGATVALPNDPSNEGRTLILMDKEGLLTLKDNTNLNATPMDIEKNPHDYQFREIDAAQLPRTLDDVDMAFINSTYSQPAGLPLSSALIREGADSPYVNLIVVRKGDENSEKIKHLVEAYQTDTVVEKAKELFQGGAVAGWK